MLQSDSASSLHLSLLGPPRAVRGGSPITTFRTSKSQALLYYLAVTGTVQRRSTLVALLWPDRDEVQAGASLRTALSDLRKLVGEHLEVTRYTAALRAEALWLDVAQFNALLQRTADRKTDILQMQVAASLYAGDFLEGFHVSGAPQFDLWMTIERERLRQAMLNTLLALADWHAEQLDYAASLDHLTRLLAIEPASEAGHRQKMVVLTRMGQRSTALQQYEACRRILSEELGVDPSPETMAIYELILSGALEARGSALGAAVRVVETPTPAQFQPPASFPPTPSGHPQIDWRDAPVHTAFYGRQKDLAQLHRWLTIDNAGLVAVSGMGGIGKTTLAVESVEHLPPGSYDLVIWRSLVNAPPLSGLLDAWLQAMAGQRLDHLPESVDEKLAVLFAELQRRRCLLVLDNLETVMQSGTRTGHFRPGYEDYGHLIDRMGRSRHRSCLLLTTRELPRGLRQLEENHPRVRIMTLAGLPDAPGMELLRHRGVVAPDSSLYALVDRYSGNPLALQLVADTVRDLFGRDVDTFLSGETPVFDDIRTILDDQFGRLSDLGRDIVTWLAVERLPMRAPELWEDLAHPPAWRDFLEVMRSLQRNSLVEIAVGDGAGDIPRLALQNVVMEYVTDRLVQTFCEEIESGQLAWFHRHALVKAHSQEFVQESQRRLLLAPIARWLVDRRGQAGAIDRLRDLLTHLRQEAVHTPSYAGANILHLLLHLQAEVRGFNFSQVAVRQADLRTASLAEVDFRGADLTGSTFADTFGAIGAVAVSPDGQYLASVTTANEATIWDWRSGERLQTLRGHDGKLQAVAFSPNGAVLATGGEDGRICLWRLATLEDRRVLKGHTGWVNSLAFSPDGKSLASASTDRTVRLWDVETGQIEHTLLGHASWVTSVAYSPDGLTVVSGGYDQQVRLWDARTGRLAHRLHGTLRWVGSVEFSPDGRLLASSGLDGPVRLWEVRSGSLLHALRGHRGAIRAVAFGAKAGVIAGGCDDHQSYLWDVRSGELKHILRGHLGMVRAIALSPDDRILVTGSHDQTLRVWLAATGQLLRIVPGANTISQFAMAFSADGELLAYAGADNTVTLIHPPSGHVVQRWSVAAEHPLVVAFSADAHLVGCGTREGTVWVWEIAEASEPVPAALRFRGQPAPKAVWRLQFSPNGRWLAAYDEGDSIHLFDVACGQGAYSIPGGPAVFCLSFSKESDALITGGPERHVVVRDAASGEIRHTLRGHAGEITAVDVSPTEDLIASSSTDGVVRLWNLQTGECLAALEPAGLYAGMKIAGVTGISAAQRATLMALGAVED